MPFTEEYSIHVVAQPIMLQQAEVLRDGSINYQGRQGVYAAQWKMWWLTGWMLSAVGLMEMPVGEMPMRGAPTLMPVAPMLMPAGEVFTKQGLYEKTEPPPDTCAARQTHHATCHAWTHCCSQSSEHCCR